MLATLLVAVPLLGFVTLLPGILLVLRARRDDAASRSMPRLDHLEPGRTGLVWGRVVGEATTTGALSGAPAILVRYHLSARNWQVFGAHHVVLETAQGERVSIAYSNGSFHSLAHHSHHEATLTRPDELPRDLGSYLRTTFGAGPFSVYVREERLSPGDGLSAIGTVIASSGAAPFELVGTRTQSLLVGDGPLVNSWLEGSNLARQMLGWVFIALFPVALVLTIAGR